MFAALSHPLRLRLYLGALDTTPPGSGIQFIEDLRPVCQDSFADHMGVAPSTLSHHVRILQDAGLLHAMRRGKTIVRWLDDDAYYELHGFPENLTDVCVEESATATKTDVSHGR